jgi:hypothetical protein
MTVPRLWVAAALFCLAAAGCAAKTEPLYRWGNYETLVYEMHANPGGVDTTTGIALLREDIERTSLDGKRVPPGVHAHLGFLYYSEGRLDSAREQFEIESRLFPESKIFMDGILERMARQ